MLFLTINRIKITKSLHFFNNKIKKITNGINIFKLNSLINYKKNLFLFKVICFTRKKFKIKIYYIDN